MAVTNIKYALSFLSDISCDLSHQCLLCLYWIGTRGFEFSLQDPITLRTKEPPPFSKNSLNPAKTVWDIMIFWENFSWDLDGCFRGNNTIPLFHLLFPLSENLKIKKELQHCNRQTPKTNHSSFAYFFAQALTAFFLPQISCKPSHLQHLKRK